MEVGSWKAGRPGGMKAGRPGGDCEVGNQRRRWLEKRSVKSKKKLSKSE